ncbi:MAG TPA: ABC-F family ATP-binding cassette domain-containing protein [Spirochaetota bacterium]|nr:ABC-F family ATP-binding cassette domain-containing protein [Spirochaetota bacterium]
MIVAENITKSYGGEVLFDSISFRINSRERAGLVGRNGHGKTTLFRILTGEEHPDDGMVTIPKNYRMGYLQQNLAFHEHSVIEEASCALIPEERMNTWKAEKILSGLGFSREQITLHPSMLSGGYQVRLSLAKVLIAEPDMLLLDEPNNYLDITSIRWLRNFLITWTGELMLITHDRNFMDSIVTHTMGIHRKNLRKIEGNTGKLYDQIAQEEEIYEKTRINDERRKKEIEQFVNRFRAKARLGNLVQSRVKMLEKMGTAERLQKIKTLDFSFAEKPTHAKYLMSAENISFSYDSTVSPIIKNFNITVSSRDRICVVGRNGKGKTTLLKLLAGAIPPDTGTITWHQTAAPGYYEQSNTDTLVKTRTVVDEVAASHESVEKQRAWDICGIMMFEGDNALKKISVLSGGEKSRVLLGKLLVTPLNILLLDEPTNHLDMEACDALLEAIDCFDGAVIMVTHNEMFLHALAERLVIFQDEKVRVYEGTYEQFLQAGGWHDDETREEKPYRAADNESGLLSKKELRKRRSEIVTERSKTLKPLEMRIQKLEADITANESRLEQYNHEMIAAAGEQDGPRIQKLSRDIHALKTLTESLYDDLDADTTLFEQESQRFDTLLGELE